MAIEIGPSLTKAIFNASSSFVVTFTKPDIFVRSLFDILAI